MDRLLCSPPQRRLRKSGNIELKVFQESPLRKILETGVLRDVRRRRGGLEKLLTELYSSIMFAAAQAARRLLSAWNGSPPQRRLRKCSFITFFLPLERSPPHRRLRNSAFNTCTVSVVRRRRGGLENKIAPIARFAAAAGGLEKQYKVRAQLESVRRRRGGLETT